MIKQESSSAGRESIDSRRDYVSVRIQMLAAVFNRKPSDEMIRVFKDSLERFSMGTLSKAFTKAEQQLERFPTPNIMRTICGECRPSTAWMYGYKEKESRDPETGMAVQVLIDPLNGEELFRPQDCPEGRTFLKKFEELAQGTPILDKDGKHTAKCLCQRCRTRRETQ